MPRRSGAAHAEFRKQARQLKFFMRRGADFRVAVLPRGRANRGVQKVCTALRELACGIPDKS